MEQRLKIFHILWKILILFNINFYFFITGKLVLKIPWKNLYGASVEATVDRLFLIVNPTAEVKYDAEKEEKMALASKQAELARVEEAKKREAEKGQRRRLLP